MEPSMILGLPLGALVDIIRACCLGVERRGCKGNARRRCQDAPAAANWAGGVRLVSYGHGHGRVLVSYVIASPIQGAAFPPPPPQG